MCLLRQMRRRGTLHVSPAVWGYAGRSWRESDAPAARSSGRSQAEPTSDASCREPNALDDLAADFLAYAFVERQQFLLTRDTQLPLQSRVAMLARQFINELERKKTPQDYYVFKHVQRAVNMLVAERVLAARPPGKIRNSTRIAPAGKLDGDLLDHEKLRELIASMDWDRKVFRWLITKNDRGYKLIEELICRLRGPCIVGELVDLLQQMADSWFQRPRQIDTWGRNRGDTDDRAGDPDEPAVEPDRRVEHEDYVRNLYMQVRQRIEQDARLRQAVKKRLLRIWDTMWTTYEKTGDFPSQSELSKQLAIDRRRLSEDVARLREVLHKINPDIRL
jgi:hypothetical protein